MVIFGICYSIFHYRKFQTLEEIVQQTNTCTQNTPTDSYQQIHRRTYRTHNSRHLC